MKNDTNEPKTYAHNVVHISANAEVSSALNLDRHSSSAAKFFKFYDALVTVET
jgi:hypothetical protein